MMFKVLSVAILVSFLFADCLADVQTSCHKPDNAIDFKIEDLDGTTWFPQRFINVNNQFRYDCARVECIYRMDKQTIFISFIYYNQEKNGNFTNDMYEITQTSLDHFILHDLKDKSMTIEAYTIRYDNFFVESVCFKKNEQFLLQGYIVWSKDEVKTDKDTLDQVVRDAGIEVENTYEVYQGDDCFEYDKED